MRAAHRSIATQGRQLLSCPPRTWAQAQRPAAGTVFGAASHSHRRHGLACCGFSSSAARRSELGERQWSTPLAKQLAEAISTTGPIPVASFMRMCLTSDVGGYYTGALDGTGRDPFGRSGDFVTSPEVSQIFGELIGIWFVTEWMAQGRPSSGVQLMEFGPGRGTLMDDMLRTIRHFDLAKSIEAVYMVEASPQLRRAQKDLLCGPDAPMTESDGTYRSISKHGGLPIVWADMAQSVPMDAEKMPLIVAHEFFDALPIHVFQSVTVPVEERPPRPASRTSSPSSSPSSPSSSSSATPSTPAPKFETQWREMVVSPTPPGSTHESLHTPRTQQRDGPVPDFQLTLASGPTKHSRYLPDISQRYKDILRSASGTASPSAPATPGLARPPAIIEICPDAFAFAADFAKRIGDGRRPAGAALVLDYGPGDGSVPVNSLRGIRRHRRVSPFAEPGLTDLSADVDFAAVAEAAVQASEGVEVHGPVDQADFLLSMGIRERAEALMLRRPEAAAAKGGSGAGTDTDKAAPSSASDIERSWKRLVDRGPGGMGKVYKVMAIVPENNGQRRPVGFGGDVVQE